MQQSRLNQKKTADNAEDNPAPSNVIERNDLEMETRLEDVLAEIERLQRRMT
jgi:hypothetical protein